MNERQDVQEPLIEYARQIGWEYVKPQDALALRRGDTGLYFGPVLEERLIALNPGVVNAERAEGLLRELDLLRPTIEGNRDALSWMRGEGSVFVPGENRERNVRLLDFRNPDNNVFQVTDEWWQRGVSARNRADAVFLINGIPVAIAETKAAGKPNGLALGVDQIRRYHNQTPEMFTATQVFEVTQLLDFYYGVTWNTSRKNLLNWKEEEPGDFERKVKVFFDRRRFLGVLKDYIVFFTVNDELNKVILRQHQTRAVEKVVARAVDPQRRRGLIWHTQGSGKTLTMITIASRLLREATGAEKPTVLMIVDRNELEAQLFRNIAGYGIGTLKVAGSKRDLREILASDYRGLVVSMIHKFDEIPANICTRESVIVLVDEAHRTTGGNLGNYLMGALPNATYIGFTGTPIDRISQGLGTFKVFGGDDETGYLDKYSIAESIEDGTTVRLNYAHGPSELRVDEEVLNREFLALAEAEGVTDVEELNAILDRAVELKEMMKSPQRMEAVAAHVVEHFTQTVEPMGFKAFLVGVDREACALYKKILDRHLPPEYSRVVYSSSQSDSALLREFALDTDDEKEIRRSFIRKGAQPKILIVTEKLLTGFDAPILYCMYLDKPMRDHVLLQAIARVNRPYEDEEGLVKPCGLVVDFVGIFDNLEKALAFDSDVVASVIQNLDVLRRLFATLMAERAPTYLPLTGAWGDKAKEGVVAYFEEKETREEFYRFFKQVQSLYDILSPDASLRPFLEDYQGLAELYAFVRAAFSGGVYVDRELTEKTRVLLRRHTEGHSFELPGAIHELGPKELAALRDSGASDTAKVLNLRKVLEAVVTDEAGSKPHLLPIGERAKALEEAYENRQVTTQQALAQFEGMAQECVDAEHQRRELRLEANAFAVYVTLKPHAEGLTAAQAEAVDALFGRYPEYQWNQGEGNQLRALLYKELRPLVGARFIEVTNALLRLQRV